MRPGSALPGREPINGATEAPTWVHGLNPAGMFPRGNGETCVSPLHALALGFQGLQRGANALDHVLLGGTGSIVKLERNALPSGR